MFGKTKKDDVEKKPASEEKEKAEATPEVADEVTEDVTEKAEPKEQATDPAMQEIYSMWLKGEQELQSVYPDFDFSEAMSDKAFSDAVMQGYSLPMAFIIAQKSQSEQKPSADERIVENGAMNTTTNGGSENVDPTKMSKEEFDKYIKKIKNQ